VREIPGGRSSSMAWCPGILRHGSYRTAVADPSREGGPLLPSPALASEHPGARTGRAVVLEHRAACGVSPPGGLPSLMPALLASLRAALAVDAQVGQGIRRRPGIGRTVSTGHLTNQKPNKMVNIVTR
jgi:hypothetical protein